MVCRSDTKLVLYAFILRADPHASTMVLTSNAFKQVMLPMLPVWFVGFSVAIRLLGGAQYAFGVLRGKARPNPITWFLWGLTPLIAFFAQVAEDGLSGQALVLLALAATPLVVCVLALIKHNTRQHFTPFAITCGLLALMGIILWRVTKMPSIATAFSIAADIFATLPTLQKAYRDPDSEYPWPYALSALSMGITLLTITEWTFVVFAFPLYMLAVNVVLFFFALLPLKKMLRAVRG